MTVHTFSLDKHLILFRPTDNRLFILNPTAGWIWQAMSNGLNSTEIAEQLADRYNLSGKDIKQDVLDTLYSWTEQGLDPTPSEKKQKGNQTTSPLLTAKAGSVAFSGKESISFQQHFYYGQNSFTLTDYTSDLTSYFSQLLSKLIPVTRENAKNLIDIVKDKNEYVISCNQVELERTPLQNIAVGRVIQAMVELGYPQTTWMAYIHASAGALDGHGIIFSAIGGSGKSTLMAALSRSGWTYWGDDTVPLDIEGKAGAMHLNQCIKSGSWDVLAPYYPEIETLPVYSRYNKKVRYLPVEICQTDFVTPLPVHSLVFPAYAADCNQSLQPISPVKALQYLIDSQTWISPDPVHAEKMINWISEIPAYSLKYHSLDWAMDRLKQLARSNNNS